MAHDQKYKPDKRGDKVSWKKSKVYKKQTNKQNKQKQTNKQTKQKQTNKTKNNK